MRDINSLNKVILIGHLGRDPEVRNLPQSGQAIARLSLATNERYFNPNTNESSDRTEWHRIVAWGKLAEFCEKYLTRGKQIYVEGKLRTRTWQDREGSKRYTTEITAQNIVLLGKKEEIAGEEQFPEEEPSSEPAADFTASEETPATPEDTKSKDEEDDIPF